MSLSPLEDPRGKPFREEAADLFATNAVGIFSFTILVYDHILTFPDEVQVIWKRPKGSSPGILIYLFIILRYIAPLGFTVQLCSFLLPPDIWTKEICSRYVVFEGCMTVTGLGLVALMMMLRVYALYGKDKRILALLAALFIFQFSVQGWLLSFAQAVVRTPGITPAGCSMIFSEDAGYWATASAWFPIVYDTVIFTLTASKTFSTMRRKKFIGSGGDWIMRTLLRDGSLYFLVILLANIPLILMIATAPPGVQNIMAQFAFLITVNLMCRITLSLRRDDNTWDIGTTAGQTGQTTLFFNDPSNPNRVSHKHGDSKAAIMKRLGTDEWDDDIELDHGRQPWHTYASGSSSTTLTPGRLLPIPRPSASDIASSRPSPIAEEDADSDADYFDPRRRRRRGTDAESDVASSRVVDLFRTYSQSSVAEVAATGSRNSNRDYDTY